FLEQDMSFNLLLLENLEKMNPGSKHQRIWLGRSENNQICAILANQFGNYYIYAPESESFDPQPMARIIQKDRKARTISGRLETVQALRPYLRFKETKQLQLAELNRE